LTNFVVLQKGILQKIDMNLIRKNSDPIHKMLLSFATDCKQKHRKAIVNGKALMFLILLMMAMQPAWGGVFSRPEPNQKKLSQQKWEMQFDSLFNAGLSLLYSNPDSAKYYAKEALEIEEIENTKRHIRALNLLGAGFNLESNFSRALGIYLEALEVAVEIDDTLGIANIYNNLGIANMKLGNYSEALDYLFQASTLYQTLDQGLPNAKASNNIGLIYMEIKNYDKALEYFNEAYNFYLTRHDSLPLSNALTNFGVFYSNTGQVDSAFKYLNKSVEMNELIDNQYGLSVVYIGMANLYKSNNKPDKAIHYFNKCLHYAQKLNHAYQIASGNLGLATIYLEIKDYENALFYGNKAIDIARVHNHEKLISDLHSILSQIYEGMGKYEKSLEHFRRNVELEKELINQTKLHQIYNIEIEYLNQAKEIQQLEIQRQELLLSKKNNVILFIIIAFGLIMGGVYLLYLNKNHRREATHQKTITNLTEKKSRAAIEAELQERSRIGQELHDGLGQMLSVARLSISALQQKSSLSESRRQELLDNAMASVDKAFYELRDISHNLAPSALSEKGLYGALKELSDQVNQSKHIIMNLEAFGLNGAFDPLIENTLYRAGQELLTNAIKHAKANVFSLQLVKSEKEITLMVEDDGQGFSMEKTLSLPGGGLNNIRSRVENLNGNIFIDAMEKRGTIVTIVIPLKQKSYAG
jgi:two-component system, NarL family, sensor kinase